MGPDIPSKMLVDERLNTRVRRIFVYYHPACEGSITDLCPHGYRDLDYLHPSDSTISAVASDVGDAQVFDDMMLLCQIAGTAADEVIPPVVRSDMRQIVDALKLHLVLSQDKGYEERLELYGRSRAAFFADVLGVPQEWLSFVEPSRLQ